MIPAKRGLDTGTMIAVLRLEQRLRDEVPALNKAISLADALSSWFGGPRAEVS